MQLKTLLQFCNVNKNMAMRETLNSVFHKCSGYQLADLHKEFSGTYKSLYYSREKSLMQIISSLELPTKKDPMFLNLRQIVTLSYYKKAQFMFRPLSEMKKDNKEKIIKKN